MGICGGNVPQHAGQLSESTSRLAISTRYGCAQAMIPHRTVRLYAVIPRTWDWSWTTPSTPSRAGHHRSVPLRGNSVGVVSLHQICRQASHVGWICGGNDSDVYTRLRREDARRERPRDILVLGASKCAFYIMDRWLRWTSSAYGSYAPYRSVAFFIIRAKSNTRYEQPLLPPGFRQDDRGALRLTVNVDRREGQRSAIRSRYAESSTTTRTHKRPLTF